MQSIICTLCGRVFSQKSGLTHHCRSIHLRLDPNSKNLSGSDGLDYELTDDILPFDNDTLIKPPDTEIFPNTWALINDTVQVHSFEDDDWDPLTLFATPQQWQLGHSIVDINLGKMKLNKFLKRIHIVPDANTKNTDQHYQLIVDMEEMDGLV
jgi:hypothetical protein